MKGSSIDEQPTRRQISVLLVDDSRDFLESAEGFLSRLPQVLVAGTCTSGAAALLAVDSLNPDVVLMDFAMPGINGFQATQSIKSLRSPPRVIMLTLMDGSAYRAAAKDAGADGYVTKSEFVTLVPPIIQALLEAPDFAETALEPA